MVEQQRGALILGPGVERDVALRVASVAGAEDARLDDDGLPGRLIAVADVDGVKPLDERTRFLRPGDEYIVCATGSMVGVPPMPMLPAKSA